MTRAYAETYLDDAMNNLGDMFDYAVYDCGYEPKDVFSFFLVSGVAEAFGKGNPKYVAGLSGPEIAKEVLLKTKGSRPDAAISENMDKSAEYWAGWILAYYQWYSGRSFADLYENGLTMEHLLYLYPTLHEADITKFVDVANRLIERNAANNVTNLHKIRKASDMTQKRLADESGVSLRMIQLYEQKNKDINKAQAITLSKIARVLGCEVEDLLESESASNIPIE
jgi:DNA-binding Xre family transcriptional regulator